ncbi:MAG: electron transport complex subunit RsxC [Firmicutes bacterium]|jgi:electron transport complex protein RnfC|nr:electron transport complex subunit RsxC [Bacillota bacterium]
MSTARTFRGGIHPVGYKELTSGKAIVTMPAPAEVIVPLKQHVGAPCQPLVKKGDVVNKGQKIGDSDEFIAAPVHAPVSGVVKAIQPCKEPHGAIVQAVVIENDGEERLDPSIKPHPDLSQLDAEAIKNIVREAGIVGLGGATFPTHAKLSPPRDKKIEALIINGCECEPYLTCDHRLMVEEPERVVFGTRALMKALGIEKAFIGIETNKPDAIAALEKASAEYPGIEVIPVAYKYPQGSERQLITAITGKQVPANGLPMDVGIVVNNVETAAAVQAAIETGMPLIERVVTVSGEGVKDPQNLLVRIGTPIGEVIAAAGGFSGTPKQVIIGGPLTGVAQSDMLVPVTKCNTGILVFNELKKTNKPEPCIRCGRCVDACPSYLMPSTLANLSDFGKFDQAVEMGLLACVECGSCSYVCPAHRFLLQSILVAKQEVESELYKKTC